MGQGARRITGGAWKTVPEEGSQGLGKSAPPGDMVEVSGQTGQTGGKAAFWSAEESGAEGHPEPSASGGEDGCPAPHCPSAATRLRSRLPPSGLTQRDTGRGWLAEDSSLSHTLVDAALGSAEASVPGPRSPAETPSWAWRGSVSHPHWPEASARVKAAGIFSGRAASFLFSGSFPGPRRRVPHGSSYPEQSPWSPQGRKKVHSWGLWVSGSHTAGPGLPLV